MSEAPARSASRRDSLAELFAGSSNIVERMPMLRLAFERAAALWTEDLASLADQAPQLVLQDVENGTAGDLLGPHDGQGAVGILHAAKWNTRLVVSADRAAVFSVVETMLGGDGSQPSYTEDRPLSRIEVRIAGAFIERMAKALETAFAGVADTAVVVEAISNEINYDVVGRRTNSVVVARFRLEAVGGAGEVLLAVPSAALSPLRQVLARTPAKEVPPPDDRWRQQIQNEVTRAHVKLTAVLDERMGTLGEVTGFEVGQVVEFNATAQGRVRLECNGERLMWCHLGKSAGKYTLRVDELVDREQEFMNEILSG